MKQILFLAFILLNIGSSVAQDINHFTDPNNRLYMFNAGVFQQIYYQQTGKIILGSDFVCYVDSKGDIFVYHDGQQIMLGQTYNELHTTDNLLVMRTANVIRIFDRGIKHILTSNAAGYGFGDSLVVFQDVIGGYVKYYYQDEVREIAMVVGDYPIGMGEIGSNVFVYKDNTGNSSVFWRGQFYDLLSTNLPVNYQAGQDVVAFNDPVNGTFAVFDNGYILDAEPQHCQRYECGDNFIYYIDNAGIHKVYREERVTELGYDLQDIVVKDSIVLFRDVGADKIWYNEEVYQIFNENVTNPQIDGGIMAYLNKWGGVSAFVRGKEIEITRQRVEEFRLHGSTILMKFGPTNYTVWWNGKKYDF
jgi:hypothetical protein